MCQTRRCLQGRDGWTQSQKTCLQMFTLTRCQSWWICLCASLHYGQTLTNQIAPLIVSLIGGLIIIRPAWWEVNIRQLSRRRRDNKEEPAAAVVLLLMVCLEQKMPPNPASICLQQVRRNTKHRLEFSAHDWCLRSSILQQRLCSRSRPAASS